MITAEEFFYELYPDAYIEHCDIKNTMIEFAKLHVKATLKQASEIAESAAHQYLRVADDENYNKDLVLNAYSLENIK